MKPNILIILLIIYCATSCSKKDSTPQLPKADFTFTITNAGFLPANVNFTSTSSNSSSYSWTFGDGSLSTDISPNHQYANEGTYNVKIVTTNGAGKDSITKQVVIIQDKPTADFTFSLDNSNQVPCNASFINTSANATSFKWYFSNGDISTATNAQTVFSLPRIYNVKLVATNPIGSDSVTKTLTINPIMKSVVVYLITPKDNQFNPNYYNALKNEATNLQTWYKSQMGNNKTFVLNPLILDTLRGLHNSAWYNSNNGSISGTDPRFYGYYNTFNEMQQQLGSRFNTSNYVFFVYVAAPGDGAGAAGFCAMGDQDLKGLLGQNSENLNPNRWIGGGGHELGHSFGLPHPDNQNGQALMWTGYLTYPNCILQQTDKDILNASTFFR
jgi:PKD repeat protein